jgi:hypothetical protein
MDNKTSRQNKAGVANWRSVTSVTLTPVNSIGGADFREKAPQKSEGK